MAQKAHVVARQSFGRLQKGGHTERGEPVQASFLSMPSCVS